MTKHEELETKHRELLCRVNKLTAILENLNNSANYIVINAYKEGVSLDTKIIMDIDDILPYELETGIEFLSMILERYKSKEEYLRRKLAAVEELLGGA